jgi:acetylornithine aminotransferase apoenzyme (EC 2.6.1.11)
VGVEFDDTIKSVDVKHECLHRHLLLTAIGEHIIRMVPPLIIDEKDCDEAVEITQSFD